METEHSKPCIANNGYSNSNIHTINNSMPWVEKYRPSCFDEIVLDPMNRTILSNILKQTIFRTCYFMVLLELEKQQQ